MKLVLVAFQEVLCLGAALIESNLASVEIQDGPFALLLIDVVLQSLFKLVVLFVNLMHIAVNDAFTIHRRLVPVVELEVLFIQCILNFEMLSREFIEEVDDECTFRLVFLEHSKNEILQVLRVLTLKNCRLLV